MIKDFQHIHGYYSPNNLFNKIIAGLDKLGKNLTDVTLEDLHPVDEFHIRGEVATKELIKLAQFSSEMHILDVGCGIGGSTRRLSKETGCRVTGIDLSDEYIDTAKRLTKILGMHNKVMFKAGNALELPFEDNYFDGVWSLQMNMNIEDKLSWLKEIYRVMKPGSRAVLYEVCGNKNNNLHFPVPWAQDSSMSYLVLPEPFKYLLTSAGFELEIWHDKTALAKKSFANARAPVGEPSSPILGLHLLVGEDIQTKVYNLRLNFDEEYVSLIEAVAVKR